MNIALIGYRGTGKSAVSQILAAKLKKRPVSLDAEIVSAAQMSIPQIVSTQGWPAFRDLEQKITAQFAAEDNLVIDCGGGVILREANVAALKANSILVWLQAPAKIIEKRISHSADRPALVAGKTFLEEIEEVLAERTPLYDLAADIAIDTSTGTLEQIAGQIIEELTQFSAKSK